MVAQVGAADVPAQGREGQHLVPEDPHVVEATPKGFVTGDRAQPVVVDEKTDGDAAGLRAFEGLVEGGGVLVPRRLEVERVDVVGRPVDAGGHLPEGLGRVVVERDDVPAGVGEAAQGAGQAHERGRIAVVSAGRIVGGRLGPGGACEDGVDEGAGLGVVIEAAPHGPPGSEDDVEGDAEEGPQEDEEQPRGGGGGSAAFRDDTKRHNTDHEIDGPEQEPRPHRRFGEWRQHVPSLSSGPDPAWPSAASVARRSRRRARAPACAARPRRGRRSTPTGRRRRPRRRSPR